MDDKRPGPNVLVMWPPQVPSYFNAGHHIGVFLVANYLRTHNPAFDVTAVDAGALNYSWKEIGDLLYNGRFDVVVVVNDFDNVDDLPRLIRYVRELSPGARIITGGRLSVQAPAAFTEFDIDALVRSGDLEAGVAGYLDWIAGGGEVPPGLWVRAENGWACGPAGLTLSPQEWVLPDVGEIPYAAYDRMYHRDQNKFCGIPQRRELVVPVARGCPVNCSFCDVPSVQGLRDRRLSVARTIGYIEECFTHHPFEYVSFYAPTFTLDRRWMESFCAELIGRGAPYPWKCATAVPYLNDGLLATMARAGCVRVSVGLETLDAGGFAALPRRKRNELDRYRALAATCERVGIELNCFVVVGLPGTSVEGNAATVREARRLGARVRPTAYSSLERLRTATTAAEMAEFNRQLLGRADVPDPGEAFALHGLVFGDQSATEVMAKIPERQAS
jgi:anaerobic magnesium-protoporphyrin IX monomethyl ester cyclase